MQKTSPKQIHNFLPRMLWSLAWTHFQIEGKNAAPENGSLAQHSAVCISSGLVSHWSSQRNSLGWWAGRSANIWAWLCAPKHARSWPELSAHFWPNLQTIKQQPYVSNGSPWCSKSYLKPRNLPDLLGHWRCWKFRKAPWQPQIARSKHSWAQVQPIVGCRHLLRLKHAHSGISNDGVAEGDRRIVLSQCLSPRNPRSIRQKKQDMAPTPWPLKSKWNFSVLHQLRDCVIFHGHLCQTALLSGLASHIREAAQLFSLTRD